MKTYPPERPARYHVETEPRCRPENVKEPIIHERAYKNFRLESEQVAEFDYRPSNCQKTYRMVVVRKNLSVEKGETRLFDEIRYFFYITNDRTLSPQQVVLFAHEHCDQENVIEPLKNGVNALRMPPDNLLAWNLKAWFGMLAPHTAVGQQIVRMEFKRFLRSFILIPCQIVRTGRRLLFRILTYTPHLKPFLETFDFIRACRFA